MVNLILHCGGGAVDVEALTDVEMPKRTITHVPIPHHDLYNRVSDTIVKAGYTVKNTAHGLTKDGQRYFGLMELTNGHGNDEYNLVVGLRNSHDKKFPAGLVCGSGVFVCDNLAFSGEIRIARKHTRHIMRDLPHLVTRAVGRLGGLRDRQDQRITAYRNHQLTDPEVHDLVIRALLSRVMPNSKIPEVLARWQKPEHDKTPTAWRLFNAFTSTLKGSNLQALPNRTIALHGLMDLACGIPTRN